jgi:hypothetical protein
MPKVELDAIKGPRKGEATQGQQDQDQVGEQGCDVDYMTTRLHALGSTGLIK